jgi:[ribosomal protein S5]-alanine N-acetyltransferase
VLIRPFRTERMTIRSLASGDRAEFVRIHELGADFYAPWIGRKNDDQTWGDIFEISLAKSSHEMNARLVGETADGRIAGFFNLLEIVRGFFENAYASWQVNPEFAGQGYATEGVTGLLDVAFSRDEGAGLHRVQANVIPSNVRSVRLAERVGFRQEGLAQKYLKIAGAWQDHLMFAKVMDEHRPTYLGRKES